MSNTSEYDGDFYEWFAKLLISQGCPEDKARECVESMKEPRKRTFGDLTVRELTKICTDHPECKDCPLDEPRLCTGYYWSIDEYTLDREVDL